MQVIQIEVNLQIPEDPNRSGGLHVSEVIRSLALQCGFLDKKYEHSDLHPILIRLGFAWEEHIAKEYPHVNFHPGEVTLDGMAGSPDGVTLSADDEISITGVETLQGRGKSDPIAEFAVHEFKFTKKSTRRDITTEWYWLAQIKAYLFMLCENGMPANTAYLHVLNVNGDYNWSNGCKPEYRLFKLIFTRLELVENWEMLVNHAQERGML